MALNEGDRAIIREEFQAVLKDAIPGYITQHVTACELARRKSRESWDQKRASRRWSIVGIVAAAIAGVGGLIVSAVTAWAQKGHGP